MGARFGERASGGSCISLADAQPKSSHSCELFSCASRREILPPPATRLLQPRAYPPFRTAKLSVFAMNSAIVVSLAK